MRRPGHPPGGLSQRATFRRGQVDDALRQVASIFASSYLRLLSQRAADQTPAPPPVDPENPVDSLRAKSVNWVDQEGGWDA
jgi:hypothetical protein